MPVVQVALNFPEEIWAGIASGIYKVSGSVVRDLAGAIVTHVPEIKLPSQNSPFDLARLTTALKDQKGAILIGLGVAVAAVGIAAIVVNKKKQDAEKLALPKSVPSFNESLGAYFVAINTGQLNSGIADRLITSLDALKADADEGKVTLDVTPKQSEALLQIAREFTIKFAEANSYKLGELPEPISNSADSSLAGLRRYLEIQQQILKIAA